MRRPSIRASTRAAPSAWTTCGASCAPRSRRRSA
jgi:hypothetical protein